MEKPNEQKDVLRKIAHRKITGIIETVSGTRVGGSETILEIGGFDSGLGCIKHPITYKPYLPGSSIKGKMRSEIEKSLGQFTVKTNRNGKQTYEPCSCGECMVCRVFGQHDKFKRENLEKTYKYDLGQPRIIVRDSQVIKGGEFEIKASTAIDRKTSTALGGSLRNEERIVSGSEFDFQIDLQIWNTDEKECSFKSERGEWQGEEALIEFIKECLRLIEQTGIGAGTSKGSGQVKFKSMKIGGKEFELWETK